MRRTAAAGSGTNARGRAPLAALLLVAAACTSTRLALEFTPAPAEVVVASEDGAPLARVLATVVEARRHDGDPDRPFELHLRVRLENLGGEDLSLDVEELLLLDAGLVPFGTPRARDPTRGEPATRVPPDGVAVVDLLVPFPRDREPADLDLEGLNLRWTLRVDGRARVGSVAFTRVRRERGRDDARFHGSYWYGPHYGPGFRGYGPW